ncbi:MAG: cytochrome c-type biogenesis protein CcmH [Alcanivoracaceae bacterium]|jgi:cytochrome c-type biogenesis protein CcmH|nr:cytochrome c-type biogenesis protein CcmH [Alcanivoracaceae bacterium]
MRNGFLVLLLLLPLAAVAAIDVYEFDTLEQEQRFRQLTEQLRCPKCQNQSISDSDAEISVEMRKRVAGMIRDGRSNEQIITFFTSRYGDFVNYDPPVRAETLVLWAAPAFLLFLGGVVIAFQVIRARRNLGDDGSGESS